MKTRIDAIAQPIDKANVIGGAKGDTERHQADAEQALAPAYDALAKAEVTKTAFETREGLSGDTVPNYSVRPNLLVT
ncbi:hypothetical protein, partial [Streptococcus pneumoniae]|uniref:hypothetical protein n=1 Tax=Streptococcus pneumoniae TaxID=1313 RepID=UPI0013DC3840